MPFLAPLAAPLITAGASVGSSLLGSKLSGGMNKEQTAATQALADTQKQAQQTSSNLLGMGTGAVKPAQNFWASLLSGDRGQITSTLAPEINQINEGYNQVRQNQAQPNPRGGGCASLMQNL